MLHSRDINELVPAPAVKVPTLTTAEKRATKQSSASDVMLGSLKRLPLYPKASTASAPAVVPSAELHVFECEPSTKSSLMDFYASPSLSLREAAASQPARVSSPSPTAPQPPLSQEGSGSLLPDHLLSNEAFLDRLVAEVRLSCHPDSEDLHALLSPPRSRSPSPCVEEVVTIHSVPMMEDPMPSSIGEVSSGSSPDPRAPFSSPLESGTALRNSVRRTRAAGVSRERSPSPVSDCQAESSPRRTSVVWAPRPIVDNRPAWNQRVPPPRKRPVVSTPASGFASGSVPRASSQSPRSRHTMQRSTSRSPRTSSGGPGVVDTTPPHARALFVDPQMQAATAAAAASAATPTAVAPTINEQLETLRLANAAAVARAESAEGRYAELEQQLRTVKTEYEHHIDQLNTRIAQLSGQVDFALRWIHNFDGATATPCPEDSGAMLMKETSPMPMSGVPQGATPTPARASSMNSSGVRLPPSPPLVLQMHS